VGSGTASKARGHDFKVGDINHDKKVDAVVRSQNTAAYQVYIQESPDKWNKVQVPASRSGEGTALGDIDNDGDLDLSDGWAWFECPEDPLSGSWQKHDVGDATHNLTRVVIADLNGDGRRDILAGPSEFGGTALKWFEAPADPKKGAWTEHVLVEHKDPNFHTVQAGDIDRDGHPDILFGVTGSKPLPWGFTMNIWYNVNGDGLSWEKQAIVTKYGSWQSVLGDVGSDGDLDILNANYQTGSQGEWWENKLDPATAAQYGPNRLSAGFTPQCNPARAACIASQIPGIRADAGPERIVLIDLSGRTRWSAAWGEEVRHGVPLLPPPAGSYVAVITTGAESRCLRVVVAR
jgi:hypothetical protein